MIFTKYKVVESIGSDAILTFYIYGFSGEDWFEICSTRDLRSAEAAWNLIKQFNGKTHIVEEFTPT